MRIEQVLRRILRDIQRGENLDLFVATAAAIALALLELLPVDVPDDTIRALTLAVLALVAVALLVNRYILETVREPRRILKHRKEFPRIELVIAEAKVAIWVSGVTLDAMVGAIDELKEKLAEGCELRLLSVRPSESGIGQVSSYYGGHANDWAGKMRANLNTLYRELVQMAPNRAVLRTVECRPGLAYFIIDPGRDSGHLTVATYLCALPGADIRPMLDLSSRTDAHWCEIYVRDFQKLWESGEDWEPSEA